MYIEKMGRGEGGVVYFFLVDFSLSLSLFGGFKEGENKKSRRGKKEVTGGGFFGGNSLA